FSWYGAARDLYSCPPRRSSDLPGLVVGDWVLTDLHTWAQPLERRTLVARLSPGRDSTEQALAANVDVVVVVEPVVPTANVRRVEDRKSTRLNSSHVKTSYAVFG